MVHGFLIHTLCPVSAGSSSVCRVLYTRFFCSEPRVPLPAGLDAGTERLLQKEQMMVVARQVKSACTLSREAAGKTPPESCLPPLDEVAAVQEADCGVFRLGVGEPFQEEKTVLWLGVLSLGFSLVCEPHENLLLAEGTLRTLARHCLEHLHFLGPPGTDVLLKVDRTEVLLDRLLPHGQLLFANHRFIHSLEKEIADYMTK
ncbi:AP-5 complex subunit sigma-1 [Acipenser oxyrinchus oxyrinchus]|uniref:AP-5 complex subunit sigma-1 n=1 Tax=Acipenser oxyrinchus oxyrinchus TaxID=40147 RepID=A0AAD8LU23_ACIOX|nr:AP-5 complex subunit sigma-1 [Acipenser oxyrinchus oxyrinchus]